MTKRKLVKKILFSFAIFRDNFLSVTNHGIDGDISDGISVISDCESINDRHSPMPIASRQRNIDDTVERERNEASSIEDINSYTLVERSMDNELQVLSSSNNDSHSPRHCVWNPSNILMFGLIVGAATILSSYCWRVNVTNDTIMPEMSVLAQRIQDLESENLALKIEVNRLVALHHAGHDHTRSHEKVVEKRSVKQKKVWTGADDVPIHIPKEPVKENYCNDEYLNSDDLFANYNFKKCENIDDAVKQKNPKVKSKDGLDDEQLMATDNSSERFESRRKKNFTTKDDNASIKREKFAESKLKNQENHRPVSEESTRNEKLVKIQEERQKIFDEATQKYLERQKKMEKKQEKDRKHREDVLKESKNSQKKDQNTDPEWYDNMMKEREKLRKIGGNSGGIKQQNKENWYTERADGREKVRGRNEKQTKQKQYR